MAGDASILDPDRIGKVTYRGQAADDQEILLRTPAVIRSLLAKANGFILFHGGLHVRGACKEPSWHSLRTAWEGEQAFHHLYSTVEADDVPFGQDCMGDQFLLRDDRVWRLSAETDEIEDCGLSLGGFLEEVRRNPEDFLSFNPNQRLRPGQLINAYPPFCMAQSGKDASLKAIAAEDVIGFHADLARQIRGLPDGAEIKIRVPD